MSAPEFEEEAEAGAAGWRGGCAGRDFDCGAAAPAGGDCDCTAFSVSRAAVAAIVQRTKRLVLMKFTDLC